MLGGTEPVSWLRPRCSVSKSTRFEMVLEMVPVSRLLATKISQEGWCPVDFVSSNPDHQLRLKCRRRNLPTRIQTSKCSCTCHLNRSIPLQRESKRNRE